MERSLLGFSKSDSARKIATDISQTTKLEDIITKSIKLKWIWASYVYRKKVEKWNMAFMSQWLIEIKEKIYTCISRLIHMKNWTLYLDIWPIIITLTMANDYFTFFIWTHTWPQSHLMLNNDVTDEGMHLCQKCLFTVTLNSTKLYYLGNTG